MNWWLMLPPLPGLALAVALGRHRPGYRWVAAAGCLPAVAVLAQAGDWAEATEVAVFLLIWLGRDWWNPGRRAARAVSERLRLRLAAMGRACRARPLAPVH